MIEQASKDLELVLQTVGGRYEDVAAKTWLIGEWMENLKASRLLAGERLSEFQLLVDGLASRGDWRAARIQKSFE